MNCRVDLFSRSFDDSSVPYLVAKSNAAKSYFSRNRSVASYEHIRLRDLYLEHREVLGRSEYFVVSP
jgi:hypothetical protein